MPDCAAFLFPDTGSGVFPEGGIGSLLMWIHWCLTENELTGSPLEASFLSPAVCFYETFTFLCPFMYFCPCISNAELCLVSLFILPATSEGEGEALKK